MKVKPLKVNLTQDQLADRVDVLVKKLQAVIPNEELVAVVCMAVADVLMDIIPILGEHADPFLESLLKEYREDGPRKVLRQ